VVERTSALATVAALLLLAMVANFFYHRRESWRLRAVLEERERMAYEIHDTLSQSFAGIGFQLKAIREGMLEQFPKQQQQLDLASELVRHSHEEKRRSIAVLRPEQPGTEGLLTALRECANRLVEGGLVQIAATCTGEVTRTPLRVADALYHIGQEALANAVRHGHPTRLDIRLLYERGLVQLRVEDNGGGFVTRDELPGFGIRSMRKRDGQHWRDTRDPEQSRRGDAGFDSLRTEDTKSTGGPADDFGCRCVEANSSCCKHRKARFESSSWMTTLWYGPALPACSAHGRSSI